MSATQPAVEKSLKSRLFILALFLASFLGFTFSVFFSNDMVNVASTLKVTVGTASQILTIIFFVSLIVGLAMGFLTVRFKHKSLFLFGVALYGVGALGSFFAPNFASILISSLILGTGTTMIGIMIYALIGDFLPLRKRGFVIGLTGAGASVAAIIVPQVTSVITNAAGWRSVLLWFILPIAVVSLLFGFFALPSKHGQEQTANKPQYMLAFKQVLSNRSAVACLVGTMIVGLSFAAGFFAVSFYIVHFGESLSTGAVYYSLASAALLLGVVVGGRLVDRIGRKRLTVVTAAIGGIFAVLIVFVPNVWVSAVLWMMLAGFFGANSVGGSNLSLEQVPAFRGTMMSLSQSFQNIGLVMGISIGGFLLDLYANNFQILYAMFGAAGLASAAVVFLFARDPCKNQLPPAA